MSKIPHPLLRSIGQTIRALRRQRGLTQEVLADLAHIDRSYMSSIERGLRNISVLNVARIAWALQVPLCHVLKGRGVSATDNDTRVSLALDEYAVALGARQPSALEGLGRHTLREKAVREWEVGCSLSLG